MALVAVVMTLLSVLVAVRVIDRFVGGVLRNLKPAWVTFWRCSVWVWLGLVLLL